MAFPVDIVVNGLSGPRCHVEANSEWSIREVHCSIWKQLGVPVSRQILFKDHAKLTPQALVGGLVADGPEEKSLALTIVVQDEQILVVAPIDRPKGSDILPGVVEEAIAIGRTNPECDVVCRFDQSDFEEKLSSSKPDIVFFCCHRVEEKILLGKSREQRFRNSDFLQIFQTRAQRDQHNPAFEIFSSNGGEREEEGSKLPQALVDAAVGVEFVVYWLGELEDELPVLYSKLLAESLLTTELTEEPVVRYYRSHQKAAAALHKAIDENLREVPSEPEFETRLYDMAARIRCYPDPPVAVLAAPSALPTSSSSQAERGFAHQDVLEGSDSVLVVAPVDYPKHLEPPVGAVEAAIAIGRAIPRCDVMGQFDLRDFHEKLDKRQPNILFLCCHREEEKIFLGRNKFLHFSNRDWLELFHSRAQKGQRNPAFVVFSTGGSSSRKTDEGSKLPQALVDSAVGVDFVVYWLGPVPDEVVKLYLKLLVESLVKMKVTEKPVERYYRSHTEAVDALPSAIDEKLGALPALQKNLKLCHDSVQQIRYYPDMQEVAAPVASPTSGSARASDAEGVHEEEVAEAPAVVGEATLSIVAFFPSTFLHHITFDCKVELSVPAQTVQQMKTRQQEFRAFEEVPWKELPSFVTPCSAFVTLCPGKTDFPAPVLVTVPVDLLTHLGDERVSFWVLEDATCEWEDRRDGVFYTQQAHLWMDGFCQVVVGKTPLATSSKVPVVFSSLSRPWSHPGEGSVDAKVLLYREDCPDCDEDRSRRQKEGWELHEEEKLDLPLRSKLRLQEVAPSSSSSCGAGALSACCPWPFGREASLDWNFEGDLVSRQLVLRFQKGPLRYNLMLQEGGTWSPVSRAVFPQPQQTLDDLTLPSTSVVLAPDLPRDAHPGRSLSGHMLECLLQSKRVCQDVEIRRELLAVQEGTSDWTPRALEEAISQVITKPQSIKVEAEGMKIQAEMPGANLVLSPTLETLVQHLDAKKPELLIFAGHGEPNHIVLKEHVLHADFLDVFRARRKAGKSNPKCVVLNICGVKPGKGTGADLPANLVKEGVRLVLYWSRPVNDWVARMMTSCFIEELVDTWKSQRRADSEDVTAFYSAYKSTRVRLKTRIREQNRLSQRDIPVQMVMDHLKCCPLPALRA